MQAALFLTPFGILSIFAENAAALFQAPLGILSKTLKRLSAQFQTPLGIISYPCSSVGTISPSPTKPNKFLHHLGICQEYCHINGTRPFQGRDSRVMLLDCIRPCNKFLINRDGS